MAIQHGDVVARHGVGVAMLSESVAGGVMRRGCGRVAWTVVVWWCDKRCVM